MEQETKQMTDMPDGYHRATMKFRMIDRMLKRYLEKRVIGTGVYRGQHQMLMHLSSAPDSSQVQLAEHMDISPAAVAVSLKKLENGGYIRRQNRQKDNRSNQIVITDKGRQAVDISIEIFRGLDNMLYQGFSEKELQQLCGFYDRMCFNLEKCERSTCSTIGLESAKAGWNGGKA